MPQCKCKTNDGSRCLRKSHADCSGYCAQHHSNDMHRCNSLARESIGSKYAGKKSPKNPRAKKSSRKSRAKKSAKKSRSKK